MLLVWGTVALVLAAAAGLAVAMLRHPTARAAPLGWKLLGASGLLFSLVGVPFMLAWEPTSGPYRLNERYPFGDYAATMQVSMGFSIVAFGLLFAAFALFAPRSGGWTIWLSLLVTWGIFWLPHAMIVLALGLFGAGGGSAAAPIGAADLVLAAVGLVYLGLVAAGFVLTGRQRLA